MGALAPPRVVLAGAVESFGLPESEKVMPDSCSAVVGSGGVASTSTGLDALSALGAVSAFLEQAPKSRLPLSRRRNEKRHYQEHDCFSNQPHHDSDIGTLPVKDFHHCREDYYRSKKAKKEI